MAIWDRPRHARVELQEHVFLDAYGDSPRAAENELRAFAGDEKVDDWKKARKLEMERYEGEKRGAEVNYEREVERGQEKDLQVAAPIRVPWKDPEAPSRNVLSRTDDARSVTVVAPPGTKQIIININLAEFEAARGRRQAGMEEEYRKTMNLVLARVDTIEQKLDVRDQHLAAEGPQAAGAHVMAATSDRRVAVERTVERELSGVMSVGREAVVDRAVRAELETKPIEASPGTSPATAESPAARDQKRQALVDSIGAARSRVADAELHPVVAMTGGLVEPESVKEAALTDDMLHAMRNGVTTGRGVDLRHEASMSVMPGSAAAERARHERVLAQLEPLIEEARAQGHKVMTEEPAPTSVKERVKGVAEAVGLAEPGEGSVRRQPQSETERAAFNYERGMEYFHAAEDRLDDLRREAPQVVEAWEKFEKEHPGQATQLVGEQNDALHRAISRDGASEEKPVAELLKSPTLSRGDRPTQLEDVALVRALENKGQQLNDSAQRMWDRLDERNDPEYRRWEESREREAYADAEKRAQLQQDVTWDGERSYKEHVRPTATLPEQEFRGTISEAIKVAEERHGVKAFASADWKEQAAMRVETPGELNATIERVRALIAPEAKAERVYTVRENGTIHNVATGRDEYVPVAAEVVRQKGQSGPQVDRDGPREGPSAGRRDVRDRDPGEPEVGVSMS